MMMMRTAWLIAVISSVGCSPRAPAPTLPVEPKAAPEPSAEVSSATDPTAPSDSSVRYLVDGVPADREAYERFRSSISEVPGTWYCDETSAGGETGWDAIDAEGTVYQVRELTERDGSISSITPK